LYSVATGDVIQQGGCFGPAERILTDRGLIPASELADRLDAGEHIQAQTHKGLRPFTYVFRNGTKELYEVTTSRGYRARVTLDHKMGVLRAGEVVTIPLRELEEGDEIVLLMGDGRYNAAISDPLTSQRAYTLGLQQSAFTRIPEAIFRSPSEVVGAFISGYFDGMGRKGNYSIDSSSRDMLGDIQQLLLVQGIVSRLAGQDQVARDELLTYKLTVTGTNWSSPKSPAML
jgi:intein/homing endonuclease